MQSGAIEAKLTKINLVELAVGSTFVAYGRSIPTPTNDSTGKSSIVWFQPISILRGKNLVGGKRVPLCNTPNDIKSYDLRTLNEPYVVFSKPAVHFYLPVHHLRSVMQ